MAPPVQNWSPARAKIQLKLSIQRIRLLAAKKSQLAKVTRREIAGLVEKGRIETARIKVEGVMGEDMMVELLEIIELYCELLLARFGLLETVRDVDPGVAEAVSGIIFAAPRTELKELHILREMLMSKYGRDYAISVMDNVDSIVSTRVTSKLSISQPPSTIVDSYLHEISKAYGIDWAPPGFISPSSTPSSTAPEPLTLDPPSSPLKHPATLAESILPDTPPVDPANAGTTVTLRTNLPLNSPGLGTPAPTVQKVAPPPSYTASAGVTGGKKEEEDAFEALSKRFAELKKR